MEKIKRKNKNNNNNNNFNKNHRNLKKREGKLNPTRSLN